MKIKITIKVFAFLLLAFMICNIFNINSILAEAKENDKNIEVTDQKIEEIEKFVKKQMKNGKIPGLSVNICNQNSIILSEQYGYSNIEENKKVTKNTFFEIGSNSKAFTGLAIRQLERDGLISLNDNVSKYIPFLKMKYSGDGKIYDITISQLLFHTSGIPFNSISYIKSDSSDKALENAVKTLINQELEYIPGSKFQYATINYDILGLVIEKVSGMTYEAYIKNNILEPLNLKNTYLSRNDLVNEDIATGYKFSFLKLKEYDAPIYKGNLPAGYFMLNSVDLVKWMQLNMDSSNCSEDMKKIISKTHEADRSVQPNDEDMSSYGSGWQIYQSGSGKIAHGGNNPNYSSYIIIRTSDNIGVGVLANINSEYTTIIANGIMDIIEENDSNYDCKDQYKTIDVICTIASIIALIVLIGSGILIIKSIKEILTRRRRFQGITFHLGVKIILSFIFVLFLLYCIYLLPNVLFSDVTWGFVLVWGPSSLRVSGCIIVACIILFTVYYNLINMFPEKSDKMIFALILLSITSGIGNSIIIFAINEGLNRYDKYSFGLVLYLLLGIIIYIIGQRIVRNKLIKITNDSVYEMRIDILSKILGSYYDKFEKLNKGNINSIMNNDIQVLSNSPNIIIGAITNLGTMLCCCIYLGMLNIYILLTSFLIISIAIFLYMYVGGKNSVLWDQTRSLQDIFFEYINDMIRGFKQIKLNHKIQEEFSIDIKENCRKYTEKNTEASISFTNVFIIGELVFTLAIASVAFLFPLIFKDIQSSTLKTYVFVFLFMAGPINGVMNSIPEMINVKISYRRIKEFQRKIAEFESNQKSMPKQIDENIKIEVKDIEYSYAEEEREFKLGPVSCEFNLGEIVFITGGNGSGKTTLIKLITGLYKPDVGKVYINGESSDEVEIGEYFSNVFSDFYLFKKLYGINYDKNSNNIKRYLKMLKIDDKVDICNGEFSSLNLSTGQRKRIALLISYLEDKPIYVFDEWASDQDPIFKKFFYEELLLELKNKGKCVILITHDDRYFHLADKLIKMENGLITSDEKVMI